MLPAQMLDEPAIRQAITRAVDTYDTSRPQLDALLELLFLYLPTAERVLAQDGRLPIERLRREHAGLPR